MLLGVSAVAFERESSAFPSSRLVYVRASGAEACPDEAALRRAVVARLGYDPFFPSADKTIIAQIKREGGNLRGSVQLIDDHGLQLGAREFKTRAAQCGELATTMALAVSIAIDPSVEARAEDEARAEEAPAAPPVPSPVAPTLPKNAAPSTASSAPAIRPVEANLKKSAEWTVVPGLLFGGSVGTAPVPAFSVGATLGVRRGAISVAAEGRNQWSASSDLPAGSIEVSLWTAGMTPCLHVGPGFGCVTASLGGFHGGGAGIAYPKASTVPFAIAGGRLGGDLPLSGPFALRAQLDLLRNLTPVSLLVDEQAAWTAPPLTASLAIGVVGHFP